MKKIKILPSVFMIIVCIAVLCVGVFSVAPTKNTINGSLLITASKPPVIISAYYQNPDGSLNTTTPIKENLKVRSGTNLDLDNIIQDTTFANDDDKSISLILQNPSSTTLGVFFSDKIVEEQSTKDDVITTKNLKTEDNQEDLVTASLNGYLNLPQKSGENNGIVETTIRFKFLKSSDAETSVDLSKTENKIYLNIEECNAPIAPTLVGTNNSLTSSQVSQANVLSVAQVNYGVTEIASNAFKNNTNLTSIEIPSTVTTIQPYAFQGCTNLTTVKMPNSITIISTGAFDGCTNLNVVELSNSIDTLDNSSFKNCTNLVDIKIPDSLTTIGSWAFSGTGLVNIEIPNTVTEIGFGAFQSCKNLVSVKLSNGITEIDNQLFSNCTSLNSLEIPNNVKTINEHAFSNCTSLNSLEIPSSVTKINGNPVSGCTGLTRIDIKDLKSWAEIEFKTEQSNPLYLAKNLYLNGVLLTDLEISSDITKIGQYAFYNATSLKSVNFLNGGVSIGKGAFFGCKNIIKVNVNSLENWLNISFGNYTSNPTYNSKRLFINNVVLTSIEIPNTITEIKDCAFYNLTSVSSVTIPSSVSSIGSHVFYGCSYLSSLQISSGLNSIGPYAFYGCRKLLDFEIPNTVTTLGSHAFYGCNSLTSIKLPSGLTSIESYLFNNCRLENVEIPSGVISIGDYAFYGCILSDINIPNTVTTIGSNVFSLNYFTTIEIPNSVTSIGSDAFYNCSKLTSVTILNNEVTLGTTAFRDCKALTSVKLEKSGNGYTFKDGTLTITEPLTTDVAPNWYSANLNTLILDIVWGESAKANTTIIPKLSFYNCQALKNIEIPGGVTSIGGSAFASCYNLTTITIKAGVDLASAYTLPTTSKTGYKCNGWYTTSDTSGTNITQISAESYTEDIIYYLVFTPNTYTATFNLVGGQINGSSTSVTKTVTYNSPIGELPAPTKDGFTFVGWGVSSTGTSEFITEETIYTSTTNKTYYAKWQQNS